MPKQWKNAAPCKAKPDTTKAHILSSLAYLMSVCDSAECQAILQVSLDICTTCSAFEENGETNVQAMLSPQPHLGLVAALAFLHCEARRNKMGDFEIVIEAANTLIQYFLIHRDGQGSALPH